MYLLRARPYRTIANMIDGVVLTFENVTKLKAAENQLAGVTVEQTEQNYLAVLRNCDDGVVLADAKGNITGVNPAFCDILGYSKEELLEKSVQEIKHRDSLDITQAKLQGAFEAESAPLPTTFATVFDNKNGKRTPTTVTVTWHQVANSTERMHCIAFVRKQQDEAAAD